MIHSQGISFFEQLHFQSSTGNQNTPQSQQNNVTLLTTSILQRVKMRKGFLTQSNKDPTGLGPLHDERSTRCHAGWGGPEMESNRDPWDFSELASAPQLGGDSDTTSASNQMDEISYQNVPNLPYKTSGEPMNALGCYYSQNYHTSHLKMSDFYYTWNDANPKSHLLLWTSIFICPLSGELFQSGEWPGNDAVIKEATTSPVVSDHSNDDADEIAAPREDSFVTTSLVSETPKNLQVRWMKKKKIAEHGAAAWAYDCFQYRHKESAVVHGTLDSKSTVILPKKEVYLTSSIGSESPYLVDMAVCAVPSYVPVTIRIRIEERLQKICNDPMKYGERGMSNVEEELAWCSPYDSQHHVQPSGATFDE